MILITGASGNVGREVLKHTMAMGAKIRAAYQDASKADAPSGAEVAIVDFNQPETLKAALQGVDRVFLVGPPTAQLALLEQKAVDVVRDARLFFGPKALTIDFECRERRENFSACRIPVCHLIFGFPNLIQSVAPFARNST